MYIYIIMYIYIYVAGYKTCGDWNLYLLYVGPVLDRTPILCSVEHKIQIPCSLCWVFCGFMLGKYNLDGLGSVGCNVVGPGSHLCKFSIVISGYVLHGLTT